MGEEQPPDSNTARADCAGGDVNGELRRWSEYVPCKIICNEHTKYAK